MATDRPVVELATDERLNHTLNSIGWYAKDHNLTPEEVGRIFDAGLVACNILQGLEIKADAGGIPMWPNHNL
jgi:hypothetical protein